jgi:hypothetical protein
MKNDILSLLKAKPVLKAENLCPLLLRHVVVYKNIDAVFICNVIILLEILVKIFVWQMSDLISKSTVVSDECMDMDNPIARENFTELLRKVRQEDLCTWDAIWFMDKIKGRHIGFDCCLKFDSFGRPEAFMWIFPHQQRNLLSYGHMIFLDGQKQQFN